MVFHKSSAFLGNNRSHSHRPCIKCFTSQFHWPFWFLDHFFPFKFTFVATCSLFPLSSWWIKWHISPAGTSPSSLDNSLLWKSLKITWTSVSFTLTLFSTISGSLIWPLPPGLYIVFHLNTSHQQKPKHWTPPRWEEISTTWRCIKTILGSPFPLSLKSPCQSLNAVLLSLLGLL